MNSVAWSSLPLQSWWIYLALACGAGSPPAVGPAPPAGVIYENDVAVSVMGPPRVHPGSPLELQVTITNNADKAMEGRLRIGVLPPQLAAREQIPGRNYRAFPNDSRSRWQDVPLQPGPGDLTFALPEPWHAPTVVVVGELIHKNQRVAARNGPRTSNGLAVLALVEVERRPTHVTAERAAAPPTVDGNLTEKLWSREGDLLVSSIDGEPVIGESTTVWFAWDDEHLYVAAELTDADIWSRFSDHDDPLYKEEAFEFFVAAGNDGRRYLEYQVSPNNVTFDASFERYRQGNEAWDSEWVTAVVARGTVGRRHDQDEGWSVEAAIPWRELCSMTDIPCPPRPGNHLRVNAFRFDRPRSQPASASALSPTITPDFHAWTNAADLELSS